MTQVTVAFVNEKQLQSGKTVYNIKGSDGVVYGCGFNKPDVVKGDLVEFEVVMNGNFSNIKKGTLKKVQNNQSTNANTSGGGGYGFSQERQDSIIYQSCLKTAVDLSTWMVEQGVVSLPSKKSEKYGAMVALVQEMTNEFAWAAKNPKIVDPELAAMGLAGEDEGENESANEGEEQ